MINFLCTFAVNVPRQLVIIHIQLFLFNIVSKQEIERLLQLFKEFTKTMNNEIKRGKGGIDRSKFRDILHQHFDMTDDVLMDKGESYFEL